MSDFDLVIRGGIIATGDNGVGPQDIGIKNGRISRLGDAVFGSCDAELDATDLYIFPGLIDAQVRFHGEDDTDEGWVSGSRALAAGGGTVALDASPAVRDRAGFEAARARAEAESLVDFALWGALTPDNLDALAELHACGVIGFQATLSGPGAVDDYTLLEGMMRAAELGHVVALRAENDALTARLAREALAAGDVGVRAYLRSRPVIAELEAIQRAILFAWETGCALHLAPVSTGRGVELIAGARAQGLNVSCATSPHYLVLGEDDAERLGAAAKCAPPLRSDEDREELWARLRAGDIDLVASDHQPGSAAVTDVGQVNIFAAPAGIAGAQATLSLLLTAAGAADGRALPFERLVGLLSAHAAHRFRFYPQKGHLAPGADGDLVIFDLEKEGLVVAESLQQRHPGGSPYLGRELRGQVRRTILRGQTIHRAGTAPAQPAGQLLRPSVAVV